jgi:3-oxoadipate enol-lactonase
MTTRIRLFIPVFITTLALVTPTAAQAQAAFAGLIDVPGGKVYAAADGTGEPILLVHGGFMDSDMWSDDVDALESRFRVLRFDLRGFGRSPASSAPYFPADDMRAVLDHFGVPRATVVGISMGGGLAIDFALAYPARVQALVLAEPGISGWQWSEDVTRTMEAVTRAEKERGRDAAIAEFLNRPVFASAKDKPKAFATIRAQLERNFSTGMRGMLGPKQPALNRLSEIVVPTLILVAERGGSDARQIAERLERDIRGARRIVVKDSGHMINLEQPAAFRKALVEFLTRQ